MEETNEAITAANDEQQDVEVIRISLFEKYLSVWVVICMAVGGAIGASTPAAKYLAEAQFAQINALSAVLLWLMILPMLIQIDFSSISAVKNAPAAIGLTCTVNYLVKPFTMYAIAVLFFRVLYVHIIPDAGLRDNYIAGLILLAGAPCTAMVFVWSSLVSGDGAYTLVQVAFNDILMVGLYAPTAILLIGVSKIKLPYVTIVYAVILFIIAPLILAFFSRKLIIKHFGIGALSSLIDRFKPVTIICLLLTLVLIFIFQGQKIAEKPVHIVLLAVPIILQCILNFGIAWYLGFYTCIPYERLAPASMIATSNFFELAVAVAISVYGLESGAALATVVGVLVEVPVMLAFTYFCKSKKAAVYAHGEVCEEVCLHPKILKTKVIQSLCHPCGAETSNESGKEDHVQRV